MTNYTAFEGFDVVATGDMTAMIAAQRAALPRGVNLLIYEDDTGQVRDVDLRDAPPPQRGRPKLGVKPREVTLLPRHWDWLADQRGGAVLDPWHLDPRTAPVFRHAPHQRRDP